MVILFKGYKSASVVYYIHLKNMSIMKVVILMLITDEALTAEIKALKEFLHYQGSSKQTNGENGVGEGQAKTRRGASKTS